MFVLLEKQSLINNINDDNNNNNQHVLLMRAPRNDSKISNDKKETTKTTTITSTTFIDNDSKAIEDEISQDNDNNTKIMTTICTNQSFQIDSNVQELAISNDNDETLNASNTDPLIEQLEPMQITKSKQLDSVLTDKECMLMNVANMNEPNAAPSKEMFNIFTDKNKNKSIPPFVQLSSNHAATLTTASPIGRNILYDLQSTCDPIASIDNNQYQNLITNNNTIDQSAVITNKAFNTNKDFNKILFTSSLSSSSTSSSSSAPIAMNFPSSSHNQSHVQYRQIFDQKIAHLPLSTIGGYIPTVSNDSSGTIASMQSIACDFKTCPVNKGEETTLEIVREKLGLGLSIVGGCDTPLVRIILIFSIF